MKIVNDLQILVVPTVICGGAALSCFGFRNNDS